MPFIRSANIGCSNSTVRISEQAFPNGTQQKINAQNRARLQKNTVFGARFMITLISLTTLIKLTPLISFTTLTTF